jgi:integrase/recombinase XerC
MASFRRRGKAGIWYYRFIDEHGTPVERKGSRNKRVAEQMATEAESQATKIRQGLLDPADVAARKEAGRPLVEHLDAWRCSMLHRDLGGDHVNLFSYRVVAVAAIVAGIDIAGLHRRRMTAADRIAMHLALDNRLRDVQASILTRDAIQAALSKIRKAGASAQTANHYRSAIRAFCRWMVESGRLRTNPVAGVKPYRADSDRRYERRPLEPVELARLVAAAEQGSDIDGVPGPVRAMAYRVAAATGLRLDEVRSLIAESFRLDGPTPEVVLPGSRTKNGKEARQPLPGSLVEPLRAYLAAQCSPGWNPAAPCLAIAYYRMARTMRADLAAAGIPYRTPDGLVDFHSLRGTYITSLIRAGANIKTVQVLARHASPTTTLQFYARATEADLRAAVEALG